MDFKCPLYPAKGHGENEAYTMCLWAKGRELPIDKLLFHYINRMGKLMI